MKMRLAYVDGNYDFLKGMSDYIKTNCSDTVQLFAFNDASEFFNRMDSYDVYLVGEEFGDVYSAIMSTAKFMLVDNKSMEGSYRLFRYQRLDDIIGVLWTQFRKGMVDGYVSNIKNNIAETMDLAAVSDEQLMDVINYHVNSYGKVAYLSADEKNQLTKRVFSSIRGLGILDDLLADEDITEIMINDYNVIFIEKAGRIMRHTGSCFESPNQLDDIIQKIVGKAGREVNLANPIVDARLEDGSRVNVVLPPITLGGPSMTIRRFPKEPMTMEKLIGYGSITPEIAGFLEMLVKAKYNIFISGGTGSGKTTFLNALSNYIPKDERLCTIEDSAELQIVGVDNIIRMETRNANTSGSGRITIKDLIKNSLRQRPDRIIVGEVRGEEALDMLQAMNTGHDGSLSTGHANSSKDMLARLETMVLQGQSGFPLEAIKQQIGSAVDIIVHLSRMRDHSRKVMEISEVIGYENGEIVLNPLYQFVENEYSTYESVKGCLTPTGNLMVNTHKLVAAGLYVGA